MTAGMAIFSLVPREPLADGFPGDDIAHQFWDLIAERRQPGKAADTHPRTCFLLASAVAAPIPYKITRDIQQMISWGRHYFDLQFAHAVIRHLQRCTAIQFAYAVPDRCSGRTAPADAPWPRPSIDLHHRYTV